MAFSSGTVILTEILGTGNKRDRLDKLSSSLSANAALNGLGGADALAAGALDFLLAYRNMNPQALSVLSANALVSVNASATTSLLTVQFQLKPAA